ncbi:helix-turn-helix transcriptional regulator [Photobacterium minamisatsumaniensis]|uniref:helix-turn-helix transcriptional regulator n=1 Tax=Photobacterium minamisatsumaniensis TaxID=2910233 RepID=UPI003D10C372
MNKERLFEMSQQLHTITSHHDIESWFSELKQEIPFIFSIMGHISEHKNNEPICIDFPSDKVNACFQNNDLTSDPLFASLLQNNHPISALLDPITHPSYGKRLVIAGRQRQSELSMLMLSFGDRQPSDDEVNALFLLAPHLYLTLNNISKPPVEANSRLNATITAREKELLHWLKIGKSNWEMGQVMGISERTVKYHLHNIYTKFGVSNRTHAVARALELEWH